jgi:dimethylglycine dehydrogenase
MAGIDLPLLPTEHQYFVTETIAEIAAMDRRLPSVADRDGEYYLRQEGQGLLVGAYEKDALLGRGRHAAGLRPRAFRRRSGADRGEHDARHRPGAGGGRGGDQAGHQRADDLVARQLALFGPVPELTGYFCCNGIIPGFSQNGGLGKLAAEWMVEGEPSLDMFGWDLARFGPGRARPSPRRGWATSTRTASRSISPARNARRAAPCARARLRDAEGDGREVRPELRLGTSAGSLTPKTSRTARLHAPALVGPGGPRGADAARPAGIIDISNFAKYRVAGPGAEDWLNALSPTGCRARSGGPA